jgi:two-component system, OmpR family, response regulator
MKTILVIDDDPKLAALLKEYLGGRGFVVEIAEDGLVGLKLLKQGGFDAIVLDVMMPKMDGFEVLQEIRKLYSIPVVMLTARGDDMDRIIGLEMGADDYLPKPFNPRELQARLKAVLRRSGPEASKDDELERTIVVGDVSINLAKREVYLESEVIEFTTMEFDILVALFERAGRVVTRDTLAEQLKGEEWIVYDRSTDVHISHIRKKIGSSKIKTIRGVGYLVPK